MADRVAIMKVLDYEIEPLCTKIETALEKIGFKLPQASRVLLKPNVLAQNTPRQCTTTHPALVDALCRLLSDRGNTLVIGESSAFYQGGYTRKAFETSGIAEVARRHGAILAPFEELPSRLRTGRNQLALPELLLSGELDQADCVINLPKLKTHAFFELSGAVKNLFGLVPGPAKYEYHFVGGTGRMAFARKLADIHACTHASVSILDAVWALEGFGPSAAGKPCFAGVVMAAANPYALDWMAAVLAGFDPAQLESIQAGLERGFLKHPETIRCVGDYIYPPVHQFRRAQVREERPKEENRLYQATTVRPVLRSGRCNACGLCISACPLGAISMVERSGRFCKKIPMASIDPARCLRCLHCTYICPGKALTIRGESWFNLPQRAGRRLLKL